MRKPISRRRYMKARSKPSPPVAMDHYMPIVRPKSPRGLTFKVQHADGYYWTGYAAYNRLYNHEGKSFDSVEEAQAAIQNFLKMGSTSGSGRIKGRIDEVKAWTIVQARTTVKILDQIGKFDSTEYELACLLAPISKTLCDVFNRALAANTSKNIKYLIHLKDYTKSIQPLLDSMNIPQGMVEVHRTVLAFHDGKHAMLARLSIPEIRTCVDLEKMRSEIIS